MFFSDRSIQKWFLVSNLPSRSFLQSARTSLVNKVPNSCMTSVDAFDASDACDAVDVVDPADESDMA
jgi:hypothetical protein